MNSNKSETLKLIKDFCFFINPEFLNLIDFNNSESFSEELIEWTKKETKDLNKILVVVKKITERHPCYCSPEIAIDPEERECCRCQALNEIQDQILNLSFQK